MRIKITFELSGKRQVLPLNYQYPVSAWIYSVFGKSDEAFTNFLHKEGYRTESGKRFKLFTFSRLRFPKNTTKLIKGSDRMEVFARKAFLEIAFYLPETAQHFVSGLFADQHVIIGDKISQLAMDVVSVEVMKQYDFSGGTVKLRTLSPVVISKVETNKKYEQYLSPEEEEFGKIFSLNLLDKYKAACKFSGKKESGFTVNDIKFENLTEHPRSALQKIKAFTDEETQVKGYLFDFELTAPDEVIAVGLDAGFGAMSSIGFGFCEII